MRWLRLNFALACAAALVVMGLTASERAAPEPTPHRHPPDPDGLYQWCPDVDFKIYNYRAEAEWWYRYQEGYREIL